MEVHSVAGSQTALAPCPRLNAPKALALLVVAEVGETFPLTAGSSSSSLPAYRSFCSGSRAGSEALGTVLGPSLALRSLS